MMTLNNELNLFATSYLPSIAYIHKLIKFNSTVIEVMENFPKQSLRNRCYIYSAHGIHCLSIPVKKKNNNFELTKDIKIDNSKDWQKLHWRSIVSSYNSSPYLQFFSDFLKPFYEKEYTYLIDFNTDLLDSILLNIIKVRPYITMSKDFTKPFSILNDFRYLCNCKTYLIPEENVWIMGMKPYHQVFSEKFGFIPNLSVIDVLFNEGALNVQLSE
ncbi:MAG: WbqC family protein [Bacteroidales bacterium]|nr:WbqC family protein [Bacteroidales bacterium]